MAAGAAAAPSAASAWVYRLPWIVTLAIALYSLPAGLSLRNFFGNDAGGALAATEMSLRGGRAGVDFSFHYGPLTLALQQLAIRFTSHPAYGLAALMLLTTVTGGWVASAAARRLRLAALPAVVLSLAAAQTALRAAPVYPLECLAVLAAVLALACGARGWALAACTAGALVKPSMAVVLGGLILAEALWRVAAAPAGVRRRELHRLLAPPLITALALAPALAVHFGWNQFVRLALPLTGARHFRAMHFSFWNDNPFSIPLRGHKWYYFASGVLAWTAACLALLLPGIGLWQRQPRPAPDAAASMDAGESARRYAALTCLAATVLFVCFFYGSLLEFRAYISLPLFGLAVLPGRPRWPQRAALALVAFLFGAFLVPNLVETGVLWCRGGPVPGTAELWAMPAERAQWLAFVRNNPPATHPLFLVGGEPEALFPAYGEPWHGFMLRGMATPKELSEMIRRAYATGCIAINPSWEPYAPEELLAVLYNLRRPVVRGVLFDTFGCAGP